MNIAFVIEHWNPLRGGAEQYAWGLAARLARDGHSVEVYTAHDDPAVPALPGVGVHPVRIPRGSRASFPFRFAGAARAALAAGKAEIVHGFNRAAPSDVLLLGGGAHRAYERWNALSEPTPVARAAKRLVQAMRPTSRALRRFEDEQFTDPARWFVAVSEKVAADLRRLYPAAGPRIVTIPLGVDLERFTPAARRARRAAARARWSLTEGDIALLWVSNNYRLKGLADLIAALPGAQTRVKGRLRLLLVGRGRAAPFLRLARRRGVADALKFLPSLPDMLDAYAAADALAHPSYYDSFGLVVAEAMACGLPVVVSENCGVASWLTDGEGSRRIAMPCPAETLSAALAEVCDPAGRARAEAVNRAAAEARPLEANHRRILALYESILAVRRAVREGTP